MLKGTNHEDFDEGQASRKSCTRRGGSLAAYWVAGHNSLYGLGGRLTELFPTESDRAAFMKTKEAEEVAAILESLPEPETKPAHVKMLSEVNGKILVAVPRTIHAALLAEAENEGISLNQLILSKVCVQLRAAV